MTESIGNGYRTEVPSLTETANIQEALRIYHYGAPSSEYDITNTAGSNFVNPSIAYYLHDLQTQVNESKAAFDPTAYDKKGSIITGGANGPITLELNPLYPAEFSQDGQVLTSDQESNSGMKWVVPQVTLINPVSISNKTFINATISAAGLKFVDSGSAPNFTTTLMSLDQDANKTVFFPTSAAVMPGASTTLVGTDTTQTLTNKTLTNMSASSTIQSGGDVVGTTATQTLTNKTISLEPSSNTITGILPVANGATPAGVISQYAGTNAPTGYLLCQGQSVSTTTFAALFAAIGYNYGGSGGSFNLPNLQNRVPVGRGTGTFGSLNATGGAETHTLTVDQMPSHTHVQNSHNHTQNAHGHSASSGEAGSHVHTASTSTNGSHTHGSSGSHRHESFLGTFVGRTVNTAVINSQSSTTSVINKADTTLTSHEHTSSGGHTHTVTVDAGGSHSHTVSVDNNTATNNATTATNQNTGGGSSHNNLQPYIVVNYIIKT
jgi:microcystin-dependent protein